MPLQSPEVGYLIQIAVGPPTLRTYGCLRVNAFGDRRTPLAINSMKGLARSHRVFKHLCALSVWQRECTRPCVQSSENYFAKLPENLQGTGKVIMSLPLEGIKVIDYTGVQSGPSCTQLMEWLGADVLKVEHMHTVDLTRIQLRDIPNVDALSITIVKLRDQERLERVGYLEEYPQYPNGTFGDSVPRGGNAGGGGQPGWVLKCKGWETDPNAYIYFTIQGTNWVRTAEAVGHPEWANDPKYATAKARQPHIFEIFADIEKFLADKTKYEAVDHLSKFEVPCAPVLSMKEIKHDAFLQSIGTVVEVPHKTRGKYWTVGCPMKFSSFTPKIKSAPLLGEHTDEVLRELGYSNEQIAKLHEENVVASTGIDSKPKSESKEPALSAK